MVTVWLQKKMQGKTVVSPMDPDETELSPGLSGASKVVTLVRQGVVSGELKPGHRLPPERDLCAQLGISRPLLREGLRALAVLGLIDVQQGRGTFIARADIGALGDALVFCLAQEPNAVEDVLQARMAIECQAIRIACQSVVDAQLTEINRKLETLVDSLHDPERGAAADHAFHLAIVRASCSPSLITMYRAIEPLLLKSHLQRRRLAAPDSDVIENLVEAHREVFIGIVHGDPDEAERRLRMHFAISARLQRSRFLKPLRSNPAAAEISSVKQPQRSD
jgi:GntR family transcriptional repressor for pyruvate dehydrogenase complex